MFSVSRRIAFLSSLRSVVGNQRIIHSRKVVGSLLKQIENDGTKIDGYGEKEICLLGPIDTRAPLPGNIGVAPTSMLHNGNIKQVLETGRENCDVLSRPLPEQRYEAVITQTVTQRYLYTSECLECIAHECPQLLKRDFLDLFPHRNFRADDMAVITFCWKTQNDTSEWSEMAEAERKQLGSNFALTATIICSRLLMSGYWADFIDPNSGRPHFAKLCSSTFETDLRYRHFGFSVEDVGCCKVISHHVWGTCAFVGAIFTNAPVGKLTMTDLLGHTFSLV